MNKKEESITDEEFDRRWSRVKHLTDELDFRWEDLDREVVLEILEDVKAGKETEVQVAGEIFKEPRDGIVLPCDLLEEGDALSGWTGSVTTIKSTDGSEMEYPIPYSKLALILEVMGWNPTHGTRKISLSRELTPEGFKRCFEAKYGKEVEETSETKN